MICWSWLWCNRLWLQVVSCIFALGFPLGVILDDGWPESVEEQGLLLLVWRRNFRNDLWKMCHRQSRRGVSRQDIKKCKTIVCIVDTQKLLDTKVFTQKLLHTVAFTQTLLHTETFTRTETFTHRRFYTQTLLHTNTLTHRRFYTQTLLHTNTFAHRRFYTQTLLHTNTFTHRSFYTQTLFTHRRFYTQTLLHKETFTHTHTDAFTHRHFHTRREQGVHLSIGWCGEVPFPCEPEKKGNDLTRNQHV